MPKIVALKPENNPDAEEAHKAILEFANSAKENGITSVMLVGISPTQHVCSHFHIAPTEHLRLLGILRVTALQLEASILEEFEE
jgi:hypothetical protein